MKDSDLELMHIEVTVFDRNRVRPNEALGKLRLGQKDNHWQQMLEQDGTMVKMMHNLKAI